MIMDYMIWLVMYGNGVLTGTVLTIMKSLQKEGWQKIPRDHHLLMIDGTTERKEYKEADPFYAPINIVRAIWLVHVAKVKFVVEAVTAIAKVKSDGNEMVQRILEEIKRSVHVIHDKALAEYARLRVAHKILNGFNALLALARQDLRAGGQEAHRVA